MASPGSLLLVRSAGDVPHSDAAFGPGSLNLVEVDAKLLGLLLRGLRGVRLLLLASSGLLGRLLSLLGCLSGNLLSLLCCLTCGVLGLARCLARLVSSLSGYLLGLTRYLSCLIRGLSSGFLGLPGCLPGGVLNALGNLSHLVGYPAQRTSALLAFLLLTSSAGETAYGVLHLPGCLSGGVLCLARCLARLVSSLSGYLLGLARYLSCLIRGLSSGFLGLPGDLSCRVLRLLGRLPRDLLHLLQGLLGSLVHRILDTRILGRLIHGALELRVRVDHLLDLGLLVTFGELLSVLLQLFAVILSLALDPTQ